MTSLHPRRTARTPAKQLLLAVAIIVVASLLGGFIGLAAALLGTTIYAWAHKDVHRGIAIALLVATVALLAITITGFSTSTSGGGGGGPVHVHQP